MGENSSYTLYKERHHIPIIVFYWDHSGLIDSQISVASLLVERQTMLWLPHDQQLAFCKRLYNGLNYWLNLGNFP